MICVSLTYVFLICTVVPLLFGLWAQFQVKSTFKRYSQVATASGMTGAQAAEAVLRNSGVTGLVRRHAERRHGRGLADVLAEVQRLRARVVVV